MRGKLITPDYSSRACVRGFKVKDKNSSVISMTTFSSIAHTLTLAHCPFHLKTNHTTLRARLNLRHVERKHAICAINLNYLPLATGFALVFFFKPLKSTPLMDLSPTRPLYYHWSAACRDSRCARFWLARSHVDQHQPLKTSVAKRSCDTALWLVASTSLGRCLLLSTYLTNVSLVQIMWTIIYKFS